MFHCPAAIKCASVEPEPPSPPGDDDDDPTPELESEADLTTSAPAPEAGLEESVETAEEEDDTFLLEEDHPLQDIWSVE